MRRSNNQNQTNQIEPIIKKVNLVGLAESGKSSFLIRCTENRFKKNYEMTIGVEFGHKTLSVADKQLKLQIWDAAGKETFRAITRSYFRGSHLIVLFIDLQRIKESITDISSQTFLGYIDEKTKFAVVFTKSDLIEEKDMPSREELQDYTQQAFTAAGISDEKILTKMYFVTSAKNNTGIEEAFQHWGECLMPTIVPQLVLPTPEKQGRLFSWFDRSSEKEDKDSEPLVSDFSF